jgi:hypothetical protein
MPSLEGNWAKEIANGLCLNEIMSHKFLFSIKALISWYNEGNYEWIWVEYM